MTTPPITIGTRLWKFDQNNRLYRDDRSGPIYSEHFVEYFVIGENRISWIVARDKAELAEEGSWGQRKVNKKTMISNATSGGYGRCQFYTDEDKAAKIWDHHHRYRIVEMLRQADAQTLLQVAQVIGYDSSAE